MSFKYAQQSLLFKKISKTNRLDVIASEYSTQLYLEVTHPSYRQSGVLYSKSHTPSPILLGSVRIKIGWKK